MNVAQMKWLIQQLPDEEGAHIRQRYAKQLETNDDIQPIYLRFSDRFDLPKKLQALKCEIELSPAIQLPFLEGHASVERTPAPLNKGRPQMERNWPSHEPTTHTTQKDLEPKVPGGDFFELARIRSIQQSKEGRGLGVAECSWVSRAYEWEEDTKSAAQSREEAAFPDVLRLLTQAELARLVEWSHSSPKICDTDIELCPDMLAAVESEDIINVPDIIITSFFKMLEAYTMESRPKGVQRSVRKVKCLNTNFVSDMTEEANKKDITAGTLDHLNAVLIPFNHDRYWSLVVVEPQTHTLLLFRPNNGIAVQDVASVKRWLTSMTGSRVSWKTETVASSESNARGAGSVLVCYNAGMYVQNSSLFKHQAMKDKELRAIRKWVLHSIMVGKVTADSLCRLERRK